MFLNLVWKCYMDSFYLHTIRILNLFFYFLMYLWLWCHCALQDQYDSLWRITINFQKNVKYIICVWCAMADSFIMNSFREFIFTYISFNKFLFSKNFPILSKLYYYLPYNCFCNQLIINFISRSVMMC